MPTPRQQPCVVPVAAGDAVAWAAGRLTDADLLLRAPLRPEAIFIANLPDLAAYKHLLTAAAVLWVRGCRALICRTGNVVIHRHLLAAGCIATAEEGDSLNNQKFRFIAGPDELQRWIFKRCAVDGHTRTSPPGQE